MNCLVLYYFRGKQERLVEAEDIFDVLEEVEVAN